MRGHEIVALAVVLSSFALAALVLLFDYLENR